MRQGRQSIIQSTTWMMGKADHMGGGVGCGMWAVVDIPGLDIHFCWW